MMIDLFLIDDHDYLNQGITVAFDNQDYKINVVGSSTSGEDGSKTQCLGVVNKNLLLCTTGQKERKQNNCKNIPHEKIQIYITAYKNTNFQKYFFKSKLIQKLFSFTVEKKWQKKQ